MGDWKLWKGIENYFPSPPICQWVSLDPPLLFSWHKSEEKKGAGSLGKIGARMQQIPLQHIHHILQPPHPHSSLLLPPLLPYMVWRPLQEPVADLWHCCSLHQQSGAHAIDSHLGTAEVPSIIARTSAQQPFLIITLLN